MKITFKGIAVFVSKALILAMIACIALFYACSRLEIKESEYANYLEVKSKNQLGNWIPEWLPNSAIEIQEKHKVDTTEVWLTYLFDEADRNKISENCGSVPATQVRFTKLGRVNLGTNLGWWPKELTDTGGNADSRAGFTFFMCDRNIHPKTITKYFMAIKAENNQLRVYYWRS